MSNPTIDNDPEEAQLVQLNRATFAAEDHASSDEMGPLLDDTFRIARSTWVVQDKTDALKHTTSDKSGRTRDVSDERVRRWGDRAVVMSLVTLREPGGQIAGRFWNTKLCLKHEDTWRCAAWQVVRVPD